MHLCLSALLFLHVHLNAVAPPALGCHNGMFKSELWHCQISDEMHSEGAMFAPVILELADVVVLGCACTTARHCVACNGMQLCLAQWIRKAGAKIPMRHDFPPDDRAGVVTVVAPGCG